MLAEFSANINTVSLIAPGPPMGFGGIHGQKGGPNNPNYSGSGGGIVVEKFAKNIMNGDRSGDDPMYSPRNVMNRLFWKEGFSAEREEDILTAMLQIHTGKQYYPGDYMESEFWPGVAPGSYGPVNALSPKYNKTLLDDFLKADPKPPLLWIHGEDDNIISDQSFSDPGYQGKMELREGWPGNEVYPPQPMLAQIKYSLAEYQSKEGEVYREQLLDCGHTPFLEKPERTKRALLNHIQQDRRANKKF
jgi:pimeloyl-ACP methyl ester carboxylesterase